MSLGMLTDWQWLTWLPGDSKVMYCIQCLLPPKIKPLQWHCDTEQWSSPNKVPFNTADQAEAQQSCNPSSLHGSCNIQRCWFRCVINLEATVYGAFELYFIYSHCCHFLQHIYIKGCYRLNSKNTSLYNAKQCTLHPLRWSHSWIGYINPPPQLLSPLL